MIPKAVGYRVVVKLDPIEEKSKGGIILTSKVIESDEVQNAVGTVVDMGEFCYFKDGKREFPANWVNVGDRVMLAQHSGQFHKDKETGDIYRIVNDLDMLAKV